MEIYKMKKSTFLIISAVVLIGFAYFEASPTYSSQSIRNAELGIVNNEQNAAAKTDSEIDPYVLELTVDSVYVVDSYNNKVIYKESLENKNNPLIHAILKDNE